MKYSTFIIYLFFSCQALGQQIFSGKIIDSKTNSGIPFASIGLLKENHGTTADKNGFFVINKIENKPDTLIITSVGYKKMELLLTNSFKESFISLEKDIKILEQVYVNSKRESITLNKFKKCTEQYYISNNEYFSQLAQFFEVENKNSYLQEISICTNGKNCTFRLHIYEYNDTLFCPGKEITDSSIIVNINKTKQKINLKNFKIKIPSHKFYVSIEWLKLKENETIFKGKLGDKNSKTIMFNPGISYDVVNKELGLNKNRIWILNFNGKWKNANDFLKENNFLISIVLK